MGYSQETTCRDRGRGRGDAGASCLSWVGDADFRTRFCLMNFNNRMREEQNTSLDAAMGGGLVPVLLALRFVRVVVPHPGQAQGPRIHPTPPLVPTGHQGAPLPRFARQNSFLICQLASLHLIAIVLPQYLFTEGTSWHSEHLSSRFFNLAQTVTEN